MSSDVHTQVSTIASDTENFFEAFIEVIVGPKIFGLDFNFAEICTSSLQIVLLDLSQKYCKNVSVVEAHETVVFEAETGVIEHEVDPLAEFHLGIEEP